MINVTANRPDIYCIQLGAPAAEITAASPFAQLKFKTAKKLIDCYIQFRVAPESSSFIVSINDDGAAAAIVSVLPTEFIGQGVITAPNIAADSLIEISIDQTGLSPDTGIDGFLMIVFAS